MYFKVAENTFCHRVHESLNANLLAVLRPMQYSIHKRWLSTESSVVSNTDNGKR